MVSVAGGSSKYYRERQDERELLVHERRRVGVRRVVLRRECRLFQCVGRTGEPSWLQAGAVSP